MNELEIGVRALAPDDAAHFVALRARALVSDPLAFGASPGDDVASSVDFVRRALSESDRATFGAFTDGRLSPSAPAGTVTVGAAPAGAALVGVPTLVGIVGIRRERHRKSAHRATVWGLWVAPEQRGRGIGRALMEETLRFARSLDGVEYVTLSVGDWNGAARSLYQELGFTSWGIERDALRYGDDVVAEHHMSLRLR